MSTNLPNPSHITLLMSDAVSYPTNQEGDEYYLRTEKDEPMFVKDKNEPKYAEDRDRNEFYPIFEGCGSKDIQGIFVCQKRFGNGNISGAQVWKSKAPL
ncbi:hypothetical protein AVEN_117946-1 [Araneus ventricosus]|uniref:Uncharacterized protein n=1 Tax=Araneus ventricosus TaxID=182803 RepID=A0A4Y2KS25_ARAVE|nr:hypothetical protein AVEN_117946-1 [Araneus ventricosus]